MQDALEHAEVFEDSLQQRPKASLKGYQERQVASKDYT